MMRIIADLAGDWHRLDSRIESLSTEIGTGGSRAGLRAGDDSARHWTDHLKRDGRRDR
jgi:hypothetical protein